MAEWFRFLGFSSFFNFGKCYFGEMMGRPIQELLCFFLGFYFFICLNLDEINRLVREAH